MRAAIFRGPGTITIETVPDPVLAAPTDAIVQVTHACICGSDLWFYRGQAKTWAVGHRTGHEFMGVIAAVGGEVRNFSVGDRVLAPFTWNCGACEFCTKGVYTSCLNGGVWGQAHDGGQGEGVNVPHADATLVKLPSGLADDDPLLRRVLPLTDVLPTGHHGCVMAGVQTGRSVAVVGDGAVGLGAVMAARRLGAARIILLGHHDDRLAIGRLFGATDVVTARGEEAVEAVRELTDGGAEAVVECVGTSESLGTAIRIARAGGGVGAVGIPHPGDGLDAGRLFSRNIALRFGVAPVRAYIPELLKDVLDGTIDPSPVLTDVVTLDGVPEGYRQMSDREALKVMVVMN